MPQADLHFTSDQELGGAAILSAVEKAILVLDPDAGDCKGRAHRTDMFHHSHVLLRVSMLPKPYRDAAFAERLCGQLAAMLRDVAGADVAINVQVRFDLLHYISASAGLQGKM